MRLKQKMQHMDHKAFLLLGLCLVLVALSCAPTFSNADDLLPPGYNYGIYFNEDIYNLQPAIPHYEFYQTDGFAIQEHPLLFLPHDQSEVIVSNGLVNFNDEIITESEAIIVKGTSVGNPDLEGFDFDYYNITLINQMAGLTGLVNYTYEIKTEAVVSLDSNVREGEYLDQTKGIYMKTVIRQNVMERTYQINGSYLVGGIVMYIRNPDGSITFASGDNNTFPTGPYGETPRTFNFLVSSTVLTGDPPINWTQINFSFREAIGVYQNEITYDDENCFPNSMTDVDGNLVPSSQDCQMGFNEDGSRFGFVMNPFVLGSGGFAIDFDVPGINNNGFPFSNTINIVQTTEPRPPPVVNGLFYMLDANGGEYIPFRGFNFLAPQRPGIGLDDIETFQWLLVTARSPYVLLLPAARGTQIFWFLTSPQETGWNEIDQNFTTNFEIRYNNEQQFTAAQYPLDAIVQFGDRTPAYLSSLPVIPAKFFEQPGFDVVTFSIRFAQYDPETYSVFKNSQLMDYLNNVLLESSNTSIGNLTLQRVELGSAIPVYFGLIPTGTVGTVNESLYNSINQGSMQDACRSQHQSMTVASGARIVTPDPGSRDLSSGFPEWAIILISVLGAIIVVGMIVCFLALLAGAGYDESDSEEDTERVAGVPSPDDFFYQQSVIRDGYGRQEADTLAPFETQNGIAIEQPSQPR